MSGHATAPPRFLTWGRRGDDSRGCLEATEEQVEKIADDSDQTGN